MSKYSGWRKVRDNFYKDVNGRIVYIRDRIIKRGVVFYDIYLFVPRMGTKVLSSKLRRKSDAEIILNRWLKNNQVYEVERRW